MPDLDTNEPGAPQGLAETMAVIHDRKAQVAAAKAAKEEQRRAELSRERQARKARKDQAAGLTASVKAALVREKAKLRKQKSRANRTAEIAATMADLPAATIDRGSLGYEKIEFDTVLMQTGHGALRRIEAQHPGEIMACREVQLLMREERGGLEPSHSHFAERLTTSTDRPWSTDQARRRLDLLHRLEEPGGPFGM